MPRVKRRDGNEPIFARPNGLTENAQNCGSVQGDLDQPERRKRYTSSQEEQEESAILVALQ